MNNRPFSPAQRPNWLQPAPRAGCAASHLTNSRSQHDNLQKRKQYELLAVSSFMAATEFAWPPLVAMPSLTTAVSPPQATKLGGAQERLEQSGVGYRHCLQQ